MARLYCSAHYAVLACAVSYLLRLYQRKAMAAEQVIDGVMKRARVSASVDIWGVDEMVTHCEVMEKAAKLSLQLEAYSIPDGFEATGKYWQVVARVRDEYTNYKKLLEILQDCPADGKLTRTGRSGHDCAREMLDAEARELAMRVYDAWSARRNKLTPPERARKLA